VIVKKLLAAILLLALPMPAFAEAPVQVCSEAVETAPRLTVAEANLLLAGLGVEVKEVRVAPINGMWELIMEKSGERSVAYLDREKRHLVPGPVFDIASKSLVGAQVVAPPHTGKVDTASIPLTDSIVMGNPNGKKRLIVFTDPDCPFCAKLHWELVKLTYMEPDLAIYVKMFPLKTHPKAYDKARVILGGKSPKLLDKAFAGESLPDPGLNDPSRPVDDTIKIGETIGVSGTPTLVLPDGRLLAGVRSATQLKDLIVQQ